MEQSEQLTIKDTAEIEEQNPFDIAFRQIEEKPSKLAQHREWLKSIRHEYPSPSTPYKIGVYIRYFNQTKYDNYIEYHKQQFIDTIANCPNWKLIDFYIDDGAVAPNMESAPEWCRLLNDAFEGKVDLILTQKISNVSKKPAEISFCARMLAAQEHPIGIYFISEDLFTLASYYREDLKDTFFLPKQTEASLPLNMLEGEVQQDD